jgi:ADP-heptose:LPS heptosyltransferase
MISPDRILIIRPDGLGDLILSLPVAQSLKESFPESRIAYVVSHRASGILPSVDYVDDWIVDDDGSGSRLSLLGLARRVRNDRYDTVIELKPSWRTALAGLLSGARNRIGTSRRFYSPLYNRRVAVHRRGSGHHQTDLDLMLLRPLGIDVSGRLPILDVTDRGLRSAKMLLKLSNDSYIVIHPGSAGSAPNWPVENYRRLAEIILNETDYSVVVTDRRNSVAGFDGCLNIAGKTDIETLAAVLKGARVFVSGSTGPLHLADAVGTRCISFFSSRQDIGPDRWGPRRNADGIIVPERPCACGISERCRCLESIGPREAFNRIEERLREVNDPAPEK